MQHVDTTTEMSSFKFIILGHYLFVDTITNVPTCVRYNFRKYRGEERGGGGKMAKTANTQTLQTSYIYIKSSHSSVESI